METHYLEGLRTDGRILKLVLHGMGVDSNCVAEDREWWPPHVQTDVQRGCINCDNM